MDSVGTRAVVLSAKIWTTDPDTPSAIAQGTFMLPRKDGNHHSPPDYSLPMSSPKEEVKPSPQGEISPIAAASGSSSSSRASPGVSRPPLQLCLSFLFSVLQVS